MYRKWLIKRVKEKENFLITPQGITIRFIILSKEFML